MGLVTPISPLSLAMPVVIGGEDDNSKKIRKPYTITKSRENWTEQEHNKFLEALQLFDRDWKKIEAFVGSKTVIQIRSHAQKYFLKVQKNGTGEHVPPPRPKRKSAQPYPQKAASMNVSPGTPSSGSSALSAGSSRIPLDQPFSVPLARPPFVSGNGVMPHVNEWIHHVDSHQNGGLAAHPSCDSSGMKANDGVGSNENSSWYMQMASKQEAQQEGTNRAAPNFAEVYKFIGSVFDPGGSGHLEKLRKMEPIDRETVLLLMRNLSVNISNPDFEEHRLFLSVYDGNLGMQGPGDDEDGTEQHSGASAMHSVSVSTEMTGHFDDSFANSYEQRPIELSGMMDEKQVRGTGMEAPSSAGTFQIQSDLGSGTHEKVCEEIRESKAENIRLGDSEQTDMGFNMDRQPVLPVQQWWN